MKLDDQNWSDWAQAALDKTKKAGASDAEIALTLDIARDVSVRDDELEKAETAESQSVSLRAYVGQKTAVTSFSLTPDIDRQIEDLIAATKASPEDPYCGLNTPDQIADVEPRDFDKFDATPLMEIDALRARADEMASAVRSDLKVDTSGASHAHRRSVYAATNGLHRDERASGASQGIVAIYEGDELVRDYAMKSKAYLSDLEDPRETGLIAAERTWEARNPMRAPSGKFPILFDERVASSLIGHALSAMSGSAIARRQSWLIDYEEPILPLSWELRETPFRMRFGSSGVLDAEGFARREQAVIKDGRPQFWISNLSSARQLDAESSGHATGSGTSRGAGIGTSEMIAPAISRAQLLREMGDGILVTGFIGATINAHTGDYSRGVNGFMVRGGEIAEPINETTIAGNLKDMLPSLRMADDADHEKGMVLGSLLVAEMTVAGA